MMSKINEPNSFQLHSQIMADTIAIGHRGHYAIRLMNDARFYWLVIIPEIPQAIEIFDLSEAEQKQLFAEISQLSKALKQMTKCDKINIAAFGNLVPQLHIHLIARYREDAAWPASAIGFEGAVAHSSEQITLKRAEIGNAFNLS